jgi:predicted ATP-grasp superfamily ATP-dependent carboligase
MDLLILGASARSAAYSAIRDGFQPWCGDLFTDRDLIQACSAERIGQEDYPEGLATFAERLGPSRWLYTGALENHPDLVDRISERHTLLGNPGSVLRAVRDPLALAESCRDAGFPVPAVLIAPTHLPTDGTWLVKPIASAGGRGIRPWRGGTPAQAGRSYYQRRVPGQSLSALFLGNAGRTRLLGITRQFVGKPGNRFAYRGTLAPWPVEDAVFERIEQLGRTIAREFGLLGLFGIDLILRAGDPWLIEVNPRYTAAVEALEWATGQSFLAEHAAVFGFDRPSAPIVIAPEGFVGKLILYADRSFAWATDFQPMGKFDQMPEIADVPWHGTTFSPGEPVMTVLASGDTPEECRSQLAGRMRRWRGQIAEMSSSAASNLK